MNGILTQNRVWFPSTLFRRIPNKRNLPDYHEIIKDPTAISTLKHKIQTKRYTGIPEFVRDFAKIVHNAQIYNKPNSQPVRDVFELQRVFKQELKNLVDDDLIAEGDTVFPDLGDIPYATPRTRTRKKAREPENADHGQVMLARKAKTTMDKKLLKPTGKNAVDHQRWTLPWRRGSR